MSDTAKTEAPDVPMETEAPESSPQEEASGVKVEPTEDSPQREESETKDEHMGATEEFNDEAMAPEGSPEGEESMPPDISPERDDGLHDQGIWGRVKNVVDPEARQPQAPRQRMRRHSRTWRTRMTRRISSALRSSSTSARSSSLEEVPCRCSSSRRMDTPQLAFIKVASETNMSAPSRFNIWLGVSMRIRIRE